MKTGSSIIVLPVIMLVGVLCPKYSLAVDISFGTDTGRVLGVATGTAYLVTLQSHMNPAWVSDIYDVWGVLNNCDIVATADIVDGAIDEYAWGVDVAGKQLYLVVCGADGSWAAITASDWMTYDPNGYLEIDLGTYEYYNWSFSYSGWPDVIVNRTLADYFTYVAWPGDHGDISPYGVVNAGYQYPPSYPNVSFTATPLPGYDVAEWVVNGVVCQIGGTNFNASGSYQVHVVFRPANPKLTLGPDQSISFMSHTNFSYQISWATNLCTSNWIMTGFTNWTGTGSNQTHTLPSNGLSPCFYRMTISER